MLDPIYPERAWRGQPQPPAPRTHDSGLVEKVLEHQFLAALTPELLRRGLRFDELRGAFDLDGHDIVLEAADVTRHIQLKSVVLGGKARYVPVNTRLADKPSGCVIWMVYDPTSLGIVGWRWFGAPPGMRLPHLGERVAKHSRGNSAGIKAERPNIRLLPVTAFEQIADVATLADRLFGSPSLTCLRRHLASSRTPVSAWLDLVRGGAFKAIPADLDWDGSCELAHLVDGYALAADLGLGDPMAFEEQALEHARRAGSWNGDAARLWTLLFLEHRRWRFGALEPDPAMRALLDTLVHQLRSALTGENAR